MALRTQVSEDLWGSPGAMTGASLQSWSRGQHMTSPLLHGLALPFPSSQCCASLGLSVGEVLPLWGGRWMGEGSTFPLRVPQEAAGRGQGTLSLWDPRSPALEVS